MKYLYSLLLTMFIINMPTETLCWGWGEARDVYNKPVTEAKTDQSMRQEQNKAMADVSAQRLALLKENRAKHAEIAQEVSNGTLAENNINFAEVSEQKQAILDQPAKDYFFNSWSPKNMREIFTKTNNDGIVMTEEEEAKMMDEFRSAQKEFQKNKNDIKNNLRLANELRDANTNKQVLSNAAKIQITKNLMSWPDTFDKVINLGIKQNTNYETKIDDIFYQNTKNGVQRSGLSKEEQIFIPNRNSDTSIQKQAQEYAQRYEDAHKRITTVNPQELTARIKQENYELANSAIPKAQSFLNPSNAMNAGTIAYNVYDAYNTLYKKPTT